MPASMYEKNPAGTQRWNNVDLTLNKMLNQRWIDIVSKLCVRGENSFSVNK